MNRVDWKTFEAQAENFFENHLKIKLFRRMPVKLSNGQTHKFDLVSEDNRVVIECKDYSWRPRGGYPNAKDAELKNTIGYLLDSGANQRILALNEDLYGDKSLVEALVRRNRPRLDSIEVWLAKDGTFQLFAKFSTNRSISDDDSRVVEQAVIRLNEIASRNVAPIPVPIWGLAIFLGVTRNKLEQLAAQICHRLCENGLQAQFDGRNFLIGKGQSEA
jgi:hypothetical protein